MRRAYPLAARSRLHFSSRSSAQRRNLSAGCGLAQCVVRWLDCGNRIETTRYFEQPVLRKRQLYSRQWCPDIVRGRFGARSMRTADFAFGALVASGLRLDRAICEL